MKSFAFLALGVALVASSAASARSHGMSLPSSGPTMMGPSQGKIMFSLLGPQEKSFSHADRDERGERHRWRKVEFFEFERRERHHRHYRFERRRKLVLDGAPLDPGIGGDTNPAPL